MKWLIVEDALRDQKGHWFEYVRAFRNGLLSLGDQVTILADKNAEDFIRTELAANPALPESIWHRMGDGSGLLTRYLRIPVHAFHTWHSMKNILKMNADYDVIFVPTVSVHHLLGWAPLIKGVLQNRKARVLLYFLSTPIKLRSTGEPQWVNSATTKLMKVLLHALRKEIVSGKVVIGVETNPLQRAFAELTAVPVSYLPQPVEPWEPNADIVKDGHLFACYGAARHEKGSDLLQLAIERYFTIHPQSQIRFVLQWIKDFPDENGQMVCKSPKLMDDRRVKFITGYFHDGEYCRWLSQTSLVLLPYRLSSYQLRGSRVVIEAMVNAIPVVTTRGTTLAQQAEEFGAAELNRNEDVTSLAAAIARAEQNLKSMAARARERRVKAIRHFSVTHFRDLLCPTNFTKTPRSSHTSRIASVSN